MIALGGPPAEARRRHRGALEPTGGELAEVAVVRAPPDTAALAAAAPSTQFERRTGPAAARGARPPARQRSSCAGGASCSDGVREQPLRAARAARAAGSTASILVRDVPRRPRARTRRRRREALEAGLLRRHRRRPGADGRRGRAQRRRGILDPASSTHSTSPTVDSIDLISGKVALVFALLGAEGNFGIKDSADSLLPELLVPAGQRADERLAGSRSRSPSPLACGPRRAPGAEARRAGPRELRGRVAALPAGAVLVAVSLVALAPLAPLDDRADLDLLDPELRRWFAYVVGVAFLGLLDDALGRGGGGRHAAGLARARARGALRALLDRGDQGGRRVRARRLRDLGPRPRERSTTSSTWRCCCSRPTWPTSSTCARAAPRRRSSLVGAGLCLGAWTAGAARAARAVHRPGDRRRLASRCASGRCSATPART